MHIAPTSLAEGRLRRRSADGAGCGPCGVARKPRTRAAPGPAGRHYDRSAGSLLDGSASNAGSRKPGPELRRRRLARNAAVEAAEARGQRHWPVIPGVSRNRPDRKAGHGCGVPHQRLWRCPSTRAQRRRRATLAAA